MGRYDKLSEVQESLLRAVLLGVVVCLNGSLAACGVDFNAPKLVLLVQDEAIIFANPDERQDMRGGETVLTIRNESSQGRQITLARLGDSGSVTRELLEVELPKNDQRIVDITPVLAPMAAGEKQGDGVERAASSARFHIYLAPGIRYTLFDRLGGLEDGVVLLFVPGEASL